MAIASQEDIGFMRRCLQLAGLGEGFTMPNPMVGAVLVHEGRIIGEGWHQRAGQPHAEVNAVASVLEQDRKWIPFSTLYVNLEPCNHHGKTPPCTELILREGIKKVVIGSVDENPQVGGKGIERLRKAGVQVIAGVLEEECRELNRRFFFPHRLNRPYITLKWAQSRDGYMSMSDGKPVAITGAVTQRFTHRLRAAHMAILVGWKTVLHDRPSLDNRLWRGLSPQVVVLDLNGRLKEDQHLQKNPEWWRWVKKEHAKRENDFSTQGEGLPSLLDHLHGNHIQSLLVEGGTTTLNAFLNAGCWDEAIRYTGAIEIGEGLAAPSISACMEAGFSLEKDWVEIFKNR